MSLDTYASVIRLDKDSITIENVQMMEKRVGNRNSFSDVYLRLRFGYRVSDPAPCEKCNNTIQISINELNVAR